MFKKIMNPEEPGHILSMLIGVSFVCLIVMLWVHFDRMTVIENNQETYKNLITQQIDEIEEDVEYIKLTLDGQKIWNAATRKKIESNLSYINQNEDRMIQYQIDADSMSETSIKFIVDEIWTELEYLRKMVE